MENQVTCNISNKRIMAVSHDIQTTSKVKGVIIRTSNKGRYILALV